MRREVTIPFLWPQPGPDTRKRSVNQGDLGDQPAWVDSLGVTLTEKGLQTVMNADIQDFVEERHSRPGKDAGENTAGESSPYPGKGRLGTQKCKFGVFCSLWRQARLGFP